jgi:hypothetical protein
VPAWSSSIIGVIEVRSSASMSSGEYIGAEFSPTLHCACRNRIGIVSSRNRDSPKNTSSASETTASVDSRIVFGVRPQEWIRRVEKRQRRRHQEVDVLVDGVEMLLSSSNSVREHSSDGIAGETGGRCHRNSSVDENETLHSRWIPGRELDCHESTHGHSAHVRGVQSEGIHDGVQVVCVPSERRRPRDLDAVAPAAQIRRDQCQVRRRRPQPTPQHALAGHAVHHEDGLAGAGVCFDDDVSAGYRYSIDGHGADSMGSRLPWGWVLRPLHTPKYG